MKNVNPFGRVPDSSVANGQITPRACQCNIAGNTFAKGQGNDSCLNCGCNCDVQGSMDAGNWSSALSTFRKS